MGEPQKIGTDKSKAVEHPPIEPTLSLRDRFARVWRPGVDLLFPPGCTVCDGDFGDSATTEEKQLQICLDCRDILLHDQSTRCQKCGITLPDLPGSEANCPSCRDHRYRFRQVVSLGRYERDLRETVLRIKHLGERPLAVSLASLLSQEASERVAEWHVDTVVPIPMHWRRRWVRGTNHAETVAEEFARQAGGRMVPHLLVRRRNTLPQMDLAPGQRAKNVRHALRVSRSYSLRAARIALIDDILTTGATCNEAARVLLEAGASDVFVAVLARADMPS